MNPIIKKWVRFLSYTALLYVGFFILIFSLLPGDVSYFPAEAWSLFVCCCCGGFYFLTKTGFIRSKTRHYFYISVKPILVHGSHITQPDLQWG